MRAIEVIEADITTLDVDVVLKTAVQEIRDVLGLNKVVVQLTVDEESA